MFLLPISRNFSLTFVQMTMYSFVGDISKVSHLGFIWKQINH